MGFLKKRIQIKNDIKADGDVGSLIAELRMSLGLTQQQLGDLLDASHKTISKWENNNGYPEYIYRKKLCDILGITLDELHAGKIDYKRRRSIKYLKTRLIAISAAAGFVLALFLMWGVIAFRGLSRTEVFYLELEDSNDAACTINGLLIESNKSNMIFIGDIDIWNYVPHDEDVVSVDIYHKEILLYHSNKLSNIFFNYDKDNDIDPNDLTIEVIVTNIDNTEIKIKEELNVFSAYKVNLQDAEQNAQSTGIESKLLDMGFVKTADNRYQKISKARSKLEEVLYFTANNTILYISNDATLSKSISYDLTANTLQVYIMYNNDGLHTLLERYIYYYDTEILECKSGTCSTLNEALEIMAPYEVLRIGDFKSTN